MDAQNRVQHYLCASCNSVLRQKAFMYVDLQLVRKDGWRAGFMEASALADFEECFVCDNCGDHPQDFVCGDIYECPN